MKSHRGISSVFCDQTGGLQALEFAKPTTIDKAKPILPGSGSSYHCNVPDIAESELLNSSYAYNLFISLFLFSHIVIRGKSMN